jgi:hypothetical protein
LLACFTPRTSLPEMRSDELVNKISGEVINGEKPRRFQLMVLVLFTNNDFHGTFHGDMILSKSSFPFDQSKRILRLNVQNIFLNLAFAVCRFSCYWGLKFTRDLWPWSNFLGNIVWPQVSTTYRFPVLTIIKVGHLLGVVNDAYKSFNCFKENITKFLT